MINKKPLIGIIGGNGKLGHWFKIFFKNQGLRVIVADQKTKLKPINLAKKADIVIICVPISKTLKIIHQIRNFTRKESLLCDFASIKKNFLGEMLKSKSGCDVDSIHPLFGPMVLNLKNQTIIFCNSQNNKWTIFLKKLFKKNGAIIISMDPKMHDKQMAIIQALTHFINITFAKTIQIQKNKISDLVSTPIFKLQSNTVKQILSGNPKLYAEIEIENPLFLKILNDHISVIKSFASYIKKKNKNKFIKEFKKITTIINKI